MAEERQVYQAGSQKLILCIMPDNGVVISDDHNTVKAV